MKSIKRTIRTFFTNPLFIMVYFIFCYELALLCKVGKVNKTLYILLGCIVFFVILLVLAIIPVVKNNDEVVKFTDLRLWRYISIIVIVVITAFFGVSIYKSANNRQDKLSWFIERFKNERNIKFEHNNIYDYGIDGIFKDINKKCELPEKLYMVNNFQLKFNSQGIITSFDTFVYGKNNGKKEQTYLISYDKNRSEDIMVILNVNANPDYNDDKILEPLLETVRAIPIKETVSNWKESNYGLLYNGKRDWGYNTDGIIYINKDGEMQKAKETTSKIIGYTVSIFVPGQESQIIPRRFNLNGDFDWNKSINNQNEGIYNDNREEIISKPDLINNNEMFFLSKEVGYKLDMTGKALGSSAYSLSKTMDGGETWDVLNEDPFSGLVGSVSGITFINDKLGFLGALNPSGAEGKLYRTDDGGISYKKVNFTAHEVELKNGSHINPFDCPGIPYEEDGVFKVLMGQGADGDYNGNSSALYQSNDKGETWEYVKEIKKTE